jgi:hypothetical protein
VARATGRSGYRLSELPSGGLSGWFVQSNLPGRKFQSHPGVPPARLIGSEARAGEFLPDIDAEEQKRFTPSELLIYKHALEYSINV